MKTITDLLSEFNTLTGYKGTFAIMKDNIVGVSVEAPETVKKLLRLFFERNGYRYEIACMKEFAKRNPESNINCDFGVYGNIF